MDLVQVEKYMLEADNKHHSTVCRRHFSLKLSPTSLFLQVVANTLARLLFGIMMRQPALAVTLATLWFVSFAGSGPGWTWPRMGVAQDGRGPGWPWPRIGVAQVGRGPGWPWPRMGVAEDRRGPGWAWARMAVAQDGRGPGWAWPRLGVDQDGCGPGWSWASLGVGQHGRGPVVRLDIVLECLVDSSGCQLGQVLDECNRHGRFRPRSRKHSCDCGTSVVHLDTVAECSVV